jgi:hypothetical protein
VNHSPSMSGCPAEAMLGSPPAMGSSPNNASRDAMTSRLGRIHGVARFGSLFILEPCPPVGAVGKEENRQEEAPARKKLQRKTAEQRKSAKKKK